SEGNCVGIHRGGKLPTCLTPESCKDSTGDLTGRAISAAFAPTVDSTVTPIVDSAVTPTVDPATQPHTAITIPKALAWATRRPSVCELRPTPCSPPRLCR